MDKSKVKAIVERELLPLCAAMGIDHWSISISYGPIDPGNLPSGFPAAGECAANSNYDQAQITIDPEQIDTPADVLQVLRHELIHVVLTPFNLYRKFMASLVRRGSQLDTQEEAIWDHVVERGVIHLERMFDGMLKYQKAKARR